MKNIIQASVAKRHARCQCAAIFMYSTANCTGCICLKDGIFFFFLLLLVVIAVGFFFFFYSFTLFAVCSVSCAHAQQSKIANIPHQNKRRSKKLNDASNQINAFMRSTILVHRFSHHRHILINFCKNIYTPIVLYYTQFMNHWRKFD